MRCPDVFSQRGRGYGHALSPLLLLHLTFTRKAPLSDRKAVLLWLRGLDLNQRPPGYELLSVSPSAAPQCFPGLLGPEIAQNPKVVPLRSMAIFSGLGQGLGRKKRASQGAEKCAFSVDFYD